MAIELTPEEQQKLTALRLKFPNGCDDQLYPSPPTSTSELIEQIKRLFDACEARFADRLGLNLNQLPTNPTPDISEHNNSYHLGLHFNRRDPNTRSVIIIEHQCYDDDQHGRLYAISKQFTLTSIGDLKIENRYNDIVRGEFPSFEAKLGPETKELSPEIMAAINSLEFSIMKYLNSPLPSLQR